MADTWTWVYSLISVLAVSLISLIGLLTFPIKEQKLRSLLLYLVSFSAGGLFADAFIHLIPEAIGSSLELKVPIFILSGIIASFVLEKLIQWRHCHIPTSEEHPHPFTYMNLFGDGVHNFIDGIVLAGSYLASLPGGIATTLAIIFHEIPQEIGDYGVLLHGGFSRRRALVFNFLTAITAVFGSLLILALGVIISFENIEDFKIFLLSFAAGEFIYIAGSDLVPELHKETEPSRSLLQLIAFILGVGIILALVLVE